MENGSDSTGIVDPQEMNRIFEEALFTLQGYGKRLSKKIMEGDKTRSQVLAEMARLKDHEQKSINMIDSHFNSLLSLLEQRRHDLKSYVHHSATTKVENLNKQRRALAELESIEKSNSELFKNLSHTPPCILDIKRSLNPQKTMSKSVRLEPCEDPTTLVDFDDRGRVNDFKAVIAKTGAILAHRDIVDVEGAFAENTHYIYVPIEANDSFTPEPVLPERDNGTSLDTEVEMHPYSQATADDTQAQAQAQAQLLHGDIEPANDRFEEVTHTPSSDAPADIHATGSGNDHDNAQYQYHTPTTSSNGQHYTPYEAHQTYSHTHNNTAAEGTDPYTQADQDANQQYYDHHLAYTDDPNAVFITQTTVDPPSEYKNGHPLVIEQEQPLDVDVY